jgi:hypothetical protein
VLGTPEHAKRHFSFDNFADLMRPALATRAA